MQKTRLLILMLLVLAKHSKARWQYQFISLNEFYCFASMLVEDASSLKQLKFIEPKNKTQACEPAELRINLEAHFNSFLLLDASLDTDRLAESAMSLFASIRHINLIRATLNLFEIKGIDVFGVKLKSTSLYQVNLFYRYSSFQLYNAESIISSCVFDRQDVENLAPFNLGGSLLSFYQQVKYFQNTCTIAFMNANLDELQINYETKSLLFDNYLTFKTSLDTQNSTLELSSSIYSVLLQRTFGLELDDKFFNPQIFKGLVRVTIEGHLGSFAPELLNSTTISEIYLKLYNLNQFWHNNFAWLSKASKPIGQVCIQIYLRFAEPDVTPNGSFYSLAYFVRSSNSLFSFSDENFCLFRHLDYDSPVCLMGEVIEKARRKECNCTLYWLFVKQKPEYPSALDDKCLQNFYEMRDKCDFGRMLARCDIENWQIERVDELSSYHFVFLVDAIKFNVVVIMAPVVCILAAILNLLCLIEFFMRRRTSDYRSKKLLNQNRTLWHFIYWNCSFNLALSFVFLIRPLNTCIQYNEQFCSSFFYFSKLHLLDLILVDYLGNVFKLCSNFTYTSFVLYRYSMNVGCWQKFRTVRASRLVLLFLSYSLLVSVIRLFDSSMFNTFHEALTMSMDNNLFHLYQQKLVLIISAINSVQTDVLFVLVNAFFDIKLALALQFRIKSQIMSKDKESPKAQAENQVTKMIVLNGLFSLFTRMPEMCVQLIRIIPLIDRRFFPLCFLDMDPFHSMCNSLIQITSSITAISFSENFLLLYLFSPQFKTNINRLFGMRKAVERKPTKKWLQPNAI
nr:G protein-coupled receptor [Proales similis]